MTRQKKATAVRRPTETTHGGSEESGSGSDLMQQVRGWASVARDAMRSSVRGADAERELHRRRNRSGQ